MAEIVVFYNFFFSTFEYIVYMFKFKIAEQKVIQDNYFSHYCCILFQIKYSNELRYYFVITTISPQYSVGGQSLSFTSLACIKEFMTGKPCPQDSADIALYTAPYVDSVYVYIDTKNVFTSIDLIDNITLIVGKQKSDCCSYFFTLYVTVIKIIQTIFNF